MKKNRHQVLPYAIKKLKAAGYRLVSLAECTGLPAYQKTQAPTPRDVRSFYTTSHAL
ncbi:carbohydrate esterase family 4 protein [Laccaria bicolor S238N-H82]|uniref:Carbohydrate esterase family 4 protein n=1 Tax=Laccaria bicolor (strain S238N-H82 / ATCC MYA-4686) TaxID=486041 RepID=B0D828_LACBS|nr:carbohydrate esterase family 4 protein [Laccaria bicolor S238N-H82]EDR09238.1 carbohydrate esterase family 4 protein [Laccaria bicolor S238N-H82]|eukprot:XP_001880551.1 carbohydrate esterase family 4 protein [Laccaria bicolor S238N-H82]